MVFLDFLRICHANAIQFSMQEEQLKVNAPKGTLTPDIVAQLRLFKPELLAWVRASAASGGPALRLAPIAPVAPGQACRASSGQEQLWMTQALGEMGDGYHFVTVLELAGSVDAGAVAASFARIVEHHEPLRTVFHQADGVLLQSVMPPAGFAVQVSDFSAQDGVQRQASLAALQQRMAGTPFDLARDFMLRVHLVRLDEQRHQLLVVLHHIASDGWSLGILIRQFQALYGGAAALAPLTVRYADYAAWLRESLQGEAGGALRAYWAARLEGAAPLHGIPTDHPRPAQQRHHAGHLHTRVDARSLHSLRQLAQAGGATLFMVLETLFAVVLRRHSRSADILIGTPAASRPHADLEGLIGYFVNLLVLRHDVDLGLSFPQLLQQAKGEAIAALNHQLLPFDQLVRVAAHERSASYNPLVQIAFTLQNNAIDELALPGLACRIVRPDKASALFDLHLEVSESDAGLALHWEYASALFSADTIGRIAGHYTRLIARVLANPDAPLNRHDILGDKERHQLLAAWNNAEHAYPRHATLQELFETQARTRPEGVAVVLGERHVSYAQLNDQANRLAHQLRERGVKTDSLVGVCLERSLDLIVALLAIVKAGGAYVPLDPAYPQARLDYMADDSGIAILLTQASLGALLARPSLIRIVMDDPEQLQALQAYGAGNPARSRGASPSNLAYVNYTSGSTGQPKGVLIEHRGVVRLAIKSNFVPFDADSVFLQMSSVSFDAATHEIWGPLLNGGTVVLYPHSAVDLTQVNAEIVRHRVTILFLTAALFDLWSYQVPAAAALKYVISGGDVVSPLAVARLHQALPDVVFVHGYGPTENTTATTGHLMRGPVDVSRPLPLGSPVSGTTVYVLAEDGSLAPAGAVGELYTGGAGLARGYLNRPSLTDERFIANPFEPGTRLYRTGDLVRYIAGGLLEYVGRIDEQVKIRGFRIELGEIENHLARHAAVTGALVLAREDVPGQKYLAAYVTASVPEEGLAAALRAHLKAALPDYMVPAHVVVMDSLPLTPNGKIDRKLLPVPDAASAQAGYVAPRSATERQLALIWSALLQIDAASISADAGFFALGGHSLLAIRLIAEMRTRLNVEMSIKDIFAAPTLEALAALADAGSARAQRAPVLALARASNRVPASFAQQRLWFIDRFGGSIQYNMPAALRVSGQFDPDAAEQALRRIVERHEPLRTVFVNDDEGLWQVIGEHARFALARHDLGALAPAQQSLAVAAAAREDAAAPFSLDTDLMLRATYLQLGPDDGVLLINMHHIASDGWSMGIFIREFVQQYDAARAGRADPLPPLALQYADYAHWQRHWLAGAVLEQQLGYWERQLADLPAQHGLPLDRQRPPQQTFAGATLHFTVERATTDSLRQLARERQATLFMVLHGAFSILIARHANSADIVIGTPVANRLQSELEGLIGFFVNTLVLRTDCAGNPGFADYLAHVKDVNLDAQAHQDVPFEHLVDRLKPARSTQYSPLFQIMFSMDTNDGASAGALQLGDVSFTLVTAPDTAVKFELLLNARETADGLAFALDYNTALFDAATAGTLAAHFGMLLQSIAADASTPIHALPMLSAAQQQHLLHTLNDTAVPFPRELCIHELFEAQAGASPGNIALVDGDAHLTYAELNARANRLAHHLRTLGVGPESLVGLCTQRGAAMVVGLMGILKAGAAYVPLDPGYPPQRLAYMLENSAIALLLSTPSLDATVAQFAVPGLEILSLDDPFEHCPDHNPQRLPGQHAGNLAYVIYTSGSTGQPKGVMTEHRALVNRIDWMQREYALAPSDAVLQKTPFSFDVSVWELTWPFTAGARLVMARPDGHKDPTYLAHLIEAENVTTLHFVPSMFRAMLAAGLWHGCRSVRQVFCSGEALPPELVVEHYNVHAAALHNLYGPTEAAIDVSYHACRPGDTAVPIGKPIQNIELHVLNAAGQLQPLGAAGELHIGGIGLARGYLNRPELDAERFIANPFHDGARLYRTGDLVRRLADGSLAYLGRIDDQVKIRGFRIELGEIENQLALHPAVAGAVVLARQDELDDRRLVAYVIAAGDQHGQALQGALRAHLLALLPEFMVPAQFVFMEAFPMTVNGKINKKALPAPGAGSPDAFVAPRTASEETLSAIWAQVLKLDRVGVNDNFFSLGGHSLLAVQMQAKIKLAFGKELTLKDIFENASVAELAQQLDAMACVQLEPVQRLGEKAYYNTSFKQKAEWIYNQLGTARGERPWCVQFRTELPHFDLRLLERAIALLIERHETLRTTFHTVDGKLQQKVHPAQPYTAAGDQRDLSGSDDPEAALLALETDERARRFDFAKLYRFRIKVVATAAGHCLLITIDHALADRAFTAILQADFGALYGALLRGETPALAPLGVTYKDYAEWEYEEIEGARASVHRAYWHQLIGAARRPTLSALFCDHHPELIYSYRETIAEGLRRLPRALDPIAEQYVYGAVTSAGATHDVPRKIRRYSFAIRDLAYQRLQQAGAAHKTPMSVLMLSAVNLMLHRLTGQDDVLVMTLSSGGGGSQWEGVGGSMVNEIFSVSRVQPGMTVGDCIAATREQMYESDRHKIYPIASLLNELDVSIDGLGAPVFNYASGYSDDDLPQFSGRHEDFDHLVFDLNLSMQAYRNGIRVNCDYRPDLFEPRTIEAAMEKLLHIVDRIGHGYAGPIALLFDQETVPC